MRDNKFHTPDGVRDYLFEEYALKRDTERKISDTFARYGYRAVSSPTMEHVEVFEEKGSFNPKGMYKFIDRDGEILTLRSDMTPPMMRIAATNFSPDELPLRLSYIGNVFRYRENYQGKQREFTQAGVELMGANTVDAGAEVIALAINSLISAGLVDFKVFIGQVEFFRAVLSEAGFSEDDIKTLSGFIIGNNFVEYERFIDTSNIVNKQTPKALPFMTGGIDLIKGLKSKIINGKAAGALKCLEEIYDRLCIYYGLGDYVRFDLGMVGFLDYYTDIIFRGYTYGTGFSVLDGGRYMISQYAAFPSAGFAINVNDLLPAIERQCGGSYNRLTLILLAFDKGSAESAYSLAAMLRDCEVNIEISFMEGIEHNIQYAGLKRIKKIIYLKDNSESLLIETESGKSRVLAREVLLNELRGAGE